MGWWRGFTEEANRKRKRGITSTSTSTDGSPTLSELLDGVGEGGKIEMRYNRDPKEPNYTPVRKMCFSATKQHDVMRREVFGLNHPRTFDFRKERGVVEGSSISQKSTPAGDDVGGVCGGATPEDDRHYVSNAVAEEVCNVTPEGKPEAARVLSGGKKCTLIFCNSTDSAHRLTRYLQVCGVRARELTGGVSKGGRKKVIEWSEERRVIIATDSASRGMNLDVDLVVNYDLPTSLSQYVHRAGRTGRGFGKGTVVR